MSFKINNLVLSEVATPISDVFISKYMPEANHTFSVIYIYILYPFVLKAIHLKIT